ncbi:glycosyltransferase [Pseudomonas typographi]|uniref:Glycosyltransferase n=1 Tax=Pseudomonas typographi TaxID=2715964 RepID=A0ABR7Z6J4_9PSED|nr:glycosyltransferase [Pseudomonas typographi]MBD1554312.1 glycosyltransferase [Pseudomonas typographi]MBD1589541.1 glycosyltransferase [Pseudomonas typographi]MBD1600921.1 glycosyltransferase [Pseudomonas typographi]
MIGVVIPAHNEERWLEQCLLSVLAAAEHPWLAGEPVQIMVVLDSCTDASKAICQRSPIQVLEVAARNVGTARAAGAHALIEAGARWLACTDADSTVPSDWLAAQLAHQADAVCGVVEIDDWSPYHLQVRDRYEAAYHDQDGHDHIHGANLGVTSAAYLLAGGFPALPCHEDVHLVRALEATGARIAWSRSVRVRTSARLDFRAQGGFGSYLQSLSEPA